MKVDVDINACKQGERKALGNLYKAYSDRLLRICQHYVTDESTAKDILHDAFIIIFTSIKSLKDNSKLEGWMITIVRNLSLRYLQSTVKDDIPLSSLGTDFLSEEDEEEKNIELELLLSAIESLPEGTGRYSNSRFWMVFPIRKLENCLVSILTVHLLSWFGQRKCCGPY